MIPRGPTPAMLGFCDSVV